MRANYEDLSKVIHKTDKYLINFLLNLLHQENHLLKNREMHVHYVPPADDTVKMQNDTVFYLIKQNNKITAAEICEQMNISLSTAKRKIIELKEKGIIDRIGSDKTGYWKIIGPE